MIIEKHVQLYIKKKITVSEIGSNKISCNDTVNPTKHNNPSLPYSISDIILNFNVFYKRVA